MKCEAYIRDVEKSDTAVLFIHGILGSPEHFNKFIPLVPDNVSVYNILLDGHGRTMKDFSGTSMRKWKSQVDDTMQSLISKYENIIIAAHSMGTLFAIESAVKYKNNVKQLFLLAAPLRIFVKPRAIINSLKSVFNLISEKDETAVAFKNSCSIEINANPINYIGWIPRYLELFSESAAVRKAVKGVDVPCSVFFSERDELVSKSSEKYMRGNDNIQVSFLKKSYHFMYDREDMLILRRSFKALFERKDM